MEVTGDEVSDEMEEFTGQKSAGVAPFTHSILSKAVLDAIDHTDAKLAFDMMLVNEHLLAQDAVNRSLNDEVSFLKQSLAKQTKEQSEMFHYYHNSTDEHMARIAELEKVLTEVQAENETLMSTTQKTLENERRERELEFLQAQGEITSLKEELKQIHAFAVAKQELEAHTFALEAKFEAQQEAFETQVQDLERNNVLEQARTKQQLLGRMQATKAELMLRTNDQVASTTHRTLLENEHFTQELAFQSRETEKLIERLDIAHQEAANLRAKNKVLEENEQLMAKKNRYYQKILAKLQQPKLSGTDTVVQLQLSTSTAGNGDENRQKGSIDEQNDALFSVKEEQTKRLEAEAQLQRAIEWLRVFQRERQFLLVQQDEVVQFLYQALDEAATAQHERKTNDRTDSSATLQALEKEDFQLATGKRVEELIQLAPSIATMEQFGRRVLVPRPALDELSSADAQEILLFFLEKLRLYQVRIASIYPNSGSLSSVKSPNKPMLERQLGVELPLIPINSSPVSSSLKQKRRLFTHVNAAVEAGSEWMGTLKTKAGVYPQQTQNSPLSPQLLGLATNQFNFIGQNSKQTSPMKRRYQRLHHSSLSNNLLVSPPGKTQIQIQPLVSWNKEETPSPWTGTGSTASLPVVRP